MIILEKLKIGIDLLNLTKRFHQICEKLANKRLGNKRPNISNQYNYKRVFICSEECRGSSGKAVSGSDSGLEFRIK